jgi:hypothetical protein
MRPPLSDRCPREIAGRRRRRRESAVADQAIASCPQRADAGKAHCGVLNFYGARGKARRFPSVLVAYLVRSNVTGRSCWLRSTRGSSWPLIINATPHRCAPLLEVGDLGTEKSDADVGGRQV